MTTNTGVIAIGYFAGSAINNNNGNYSIIIGYEAGASMTSGLPNLFIGYRAGYTHTTGGYNIAIGHGAMDDTNAGSTSLGSSENIFIGKNAHYNLQ